METGDIILSRQRTKKVLIRLCGCTGLSAPLLFAYGKNGFSHDMAHLKAKNAIIMGVIPFSLPALSMKPISYRACKSGCQQNLLRGVSAWWIASSRTDKMGIR